MSKVRVLLFGLLASVFVFSAAPAFAQQYHNGPYPTYRQPAFRGYEHFRSGPRMFVGGPRFSWGVGVVEGFGPYGWDYDYGYGQGICGLDYYGNPIPCLAGPIVEPGVNIWFGPGWYGGRFFNRGFYAPRGYFGHFGGGFRGGRVYGGGGGRVYGGGGRGGFRGGRR